MGQRGRRGWNWKLIAFKNISLSLLFSCAFFLSTELNCLLSVTVAHGVSEELEAGMSYIGAGCSVKTLNQYCSLQLCRGCAETDKDHGAIRTCGQDTSGTFLRLKSKY